MITIKIDKEIFEDVSWFEKYNHDKSLNKDVEIEIDEATQKLLSIKSYQEDRDGNNRVVIWHKDNGFNAITKIIKKREDI